jgi:hypothetical protein
MSSSKALHALLLEASERLQDTIDGDVRDRGIIMNDFNIATRVLTEYLRIYSMLEECYDQTIHTQRRIDIRDMLVRTVTRLLELYWNVTRPRALVEGQRPFDWPEMAASIMMQTQAISLEIPIPRIVKDDTGPAFGLREDLFTKLARQFEEARVAAEITKPPPMPVEEATLIVQRAERARHARHETLIKRGIQQQQANLAHPKRQREEGDREKCANTIKEFWKKFGTRHKERQLREAEETLIGMKPVPFATSFAEKVEKTLKRRKEEERKRKQELDAGKEVAKTWLQDNKEVDLQRKLAELNAQFYNEAKLRTGKAPVIKPRTNVLLTLMDAADPTPDEEFEQVVRTQAEKKGKKKAEPAKKEAPKSMGGAGRNQKEEVPIPPHVSELKESLEKFNGLWNREDQGAPSDEFDVQLVRKEIWTSMLPDIATTCEMNLKQELKNLKILEMRRVRKARPPRQRKRRARRVRDPLGGKSDEEILAQLVQIGIACNTPTVTFKDFVGDHDLTNPSKPSYGSIRSQMMFEAVLPFACDREHQADLPKGVLIYGMRGTGKTLLALAAINALGATFLNFSPAVLLSQETPSPRILVLMLIKAAKILAPSVILVDDIHRMFGRGRKIADASRKFKAQLRRQIRRVKPRDRILLLATASAPLPKPCTTLFNRAIEVPKPDLPTRVSIWNFWLKKKSLLIPTVSVNALAFASEGYTGGSIARCCTKGARVRSSRTEPNDPITDEEILSFLADAPEDESKPPVDLGFGSLPWIRPAPVPAKKN